MNVDAAARRCTLTLKKGLIDSKLPPITSLSTAAPGQRTHGWVSGITAAGVFLGFYGGVKGLLPPSEVPQPPDGSALEELYSVGQVLKVCVAGVDPRKGLRLALSRKSAADGGGAGAAAASATAAAVTVPDGTVLTDAAVTKVEPDREAPERAALVYAEARAPGSSGSGGGTVTVRVAAEQLSDHTHAAEALASSIAVGCVLSEVLVIETKADSGLAIGTRKQAMLAAAKAGTLPSDISALQPGACVPGYIASITKDACFVRFAGGLTGRASLPQLADAFISDPSSHFAVGQSVLARVVDVLPEQRRFTVSLKPAAVEASDVELLEVLYRHAPLPALCLSVAKDKDQCPCARGLSVFGSCEAVTGGVCDFA